MTATAPRDLVERFRAGDRAALARLISFVENGKAAGMRAMGDLYGSTGTAYVVGITGPPGAGKSTLTNALIRGYRSRGQTVAVVAVDPSSALTGGATLGDRIRMLDNFDDPGVYIRSMATRGEMGGLSIGVGAVVHLLDAYGFDMILIETVGVGQDEVDVGELADTTLLIQVPGTGDSIQAIKAGVLEIADVLVVNKADLPGANDMVRDLRMMLRLSESRPWTPPIVETVASEHRNTDALIDKLDQHRQFLEDSGEGRIRRARRDRREVVRLARRQLTREIEAVASDAALDDLFTSLANRDADPITVASVVARRTVDRFRQDG